MCLKELIWKLNTREDGHIPGQMPDMHTGKLPKRRAEMEQRGQFVLVNKRKETEAIKFQWNCEVRVTPSGGADEPRGLCFGSK